LLQNHIFGWWQYSHHMKWLTAVGQQDSQLLC